MLELRAATERGRTSLPWLKSFHSFSFGDYVDPSHMGFGPLRVINEDFVQAGGGFPAHSHHDMEILTYVLEGELEHTDSLGNGSVITAGEIQKMSAGSGIIHSEFNPSQEGPVHFLQIWIQPDTKKLTPMYQQRKLHIADDELVLIGDNEDPSAINIHQSVKVFAFKTRTATELRHRLGKGKKLWLQMAKGQAAINGVATTAGDGLAITDLDEIQIQADAFAEGLLFEMSA